MNECQFSGNSGEDRPDHAQFIMCDVLSASLFILIELRVAIRKRSKYFVSGDELVDDAPQVVRLFICSALICPSIEMKFDDQKKHHFFD
jgi:hypothetical protein